MTSTRNHEWSAFLAVLPLLWQSTNFLEALWIATLVCGICWVTMIFFKMTRSLFPEKIFTLAILLWIGVLAQAVWHIQTIYPLWVVSLSILIFSETQDGKVLATVWNILFKKSVVFWVLLVSIGGMHELMNAASPFPLFKISFGAFLFLAFTSLLLQHLRLKRLS